MMTIEEQRNAARKLALLERIAEAAERIATALEEKSQPYILDGCSIFTDEALAILAKKQLEKNGKEVVE